LPYRFSFEFFVLLQLPARHKKGQFLKKGTTTSGLTTENSGFLGFLLRKTQVIGWRLKPLMVNEANIKKAAPEDCLYLSA